MESTNKDFEEAQLNFEVAKILYQNMSPINTIGFIIIIALISVTVGILLFTLIMSSIPNPSNIDFMLPIFVSFTVSCVLFFITNYFSLNTNKKVAAQHLVKMITKIKQCGLDKHFLKSDLFIPISNPSKPILYSDVENIYLKAKKEFKLQNSLNNQKEIINQCLD